MSRDLCPTYYMFRFDRTANCSATPHAKSARHLSAVHVALTVGGIVGSSQPVQLQLSSTIARSYLTLRRFPVVKGYPRSKDHALAAKDLETAVTACQLSELIKAPPHTIYRLLPCTLFFVDSRKHLHNVRISTDIGACGPRQVEYSPMIGCCLTSPPGGLGT